MGKELGGVGQGTGRENPHHVGRNQRARGQAACAAQRSANLGLGQENKHRKHSRQMKAMGSVQQPAPVCRGLFGTPEQAPVAGRAPSAIPTPLKPRAKPSLTSAAPGFYSSWFEFFPRWDFFTGTCPSAALPVSYCCFGDLHIDLGTDPVRG